MRVAIAEQLTVTGKRFACDEARWRERGRGICSRYVRRTSRNCVCAIFADSRGGRSTIGCAFAGAGKPQRQRPASDPGNGPNMFTTSWGICPVRLPPICQSDAGMSQVCFIFARFSRTHRPGPDGGRQVWLCSDRGRQPERSSVLGAAPPRVRTSARRASICRSVCLGYKEGASGAVLRGCSPSRELPLYRHSVCQCLRLYCPQRMCVRRPGIKWYCRKASDASVYVVSTVRAATIFAYPGSVSGLTASAGI